MKASSPLPSHGYMQWDVLVPAPKPPVESQSCNNCCQHGNWFYRTARSQGGRYRSHIPSLHSGAFPRVFSSHHKHAHMHAACLGHGQSSSHATLGSSSRAHVCHSSQSFCVCQLPKTDAGAAARCRQQSPGEKGERGLGGGSSAALI